MTSRRALAVVLLILAFAGLAATRGKISPAEGPPVVGQILIAVGAAACLLGGVALWVKGNRGEH